MAGGVAVFPALLGPGELEELRWRPEKFVSRPSEQISEPLGQSARNAQSSAGAHMTGEKDSQPSGYDDAGSIRSLGSMLIRDNDDSG